MAYRVLEIVTPPEKAPQVELALEELGVEARWCISRTDECVVWRALMDSEAVEPVLDRLENRFGHMEAFRVVLQAVEAVIPAPAKAEPAQEEESAKKASRISRAELYEDIEAASRLNWQFVIMVALATVVVSIGLVRDSSVIVLAAMVIAPLLGPNMALALGTTLGDTALIRRSAGAATSGFAIAFALSIAYGVVGGFALESQEIRARAGFDGSDLVLALASGVAGTLAYTTGAPASLIGVMVAVALLPPTVVAGIMLGRGEWASAGAAGMLLASNVICVHLAAVATFVVQGVKPSKWWEAEKAKRATRRSLIICVILMAGLIAAVLARSYFIESGGRPVP